MATVLKIKATNYVANLLPTPQNTRFHPFINFLNNCPVTYALTATPTMDQQQLVEYWSTASTDASFSHLSGKVNGKKLVFTSTTLASVLQLPSYPTEEYVAPPTREQIWKMLKAIGYKEKNPKVSTIVRKNMSPCWSFFFDALIRCISGKNSAWDQASGLTLQLAYGLIMGTKIHYAKLIFEDICRKVGNDHLLYPRFLSLMIMQAQVEIQTPVYILPVCRISDKIFLNKPEECERPLTAAMLSLLSPPPFTKPEVVIVPDSFDSKSVTANEEGFSRSDGDKHLVDSDNDSHSHSTAFEPELCKRICALEAAFKEAGSKEKREETMKDREYFVARFDEIGVTLSQIVTALGDIQKEVASACTKADVQRLISGARVTFHQ